MERQFRQVLARLELVSHGSTQAWNSDGRGGNERDRPPGELYPPHEHYRKLWDRQRTDEGRVIVLAEATGELQAITRRTAKIASLSDSEILRRNILDCNGQSDDEVAKLYRCTRRRVREVRVREGLSGEMGIEVTDWSTDDAGRARTLAEAGMSERQIALILQCYPSKVRRMLGKAA